MLKFEKKVRRQKVNILEFVNDVPRLFDSETWSGFGINVQSVIELSSIIKDLISDLFRS